MNEPRRGQTKQEEGVFWGFFLNAAKFRLIGSELCNKKTAFHQRERTREIFLPLMSSFYINELLLGYTADFPFIFLAVLLCL